MQTGKHVVFIVENLSVPFDRRVWREANSLKKNGFNVSVISPKGLNQDHLSRETKNGIVIYRYSLPIFQNSKFGYLLEYLKSFFMSTLYLLKINFARKIDAIHVANPPEIFFPIGWVCKIFKIKFIFDHHDLSPETFLCKFGNRNDSLFFNLLLLLERLTYRASFHVFSTNESISLIAAKRTGYPLNKTTIVRNGPDENFRPGNRNEELKRGKKFLASYIGVMGKMDGVENIIFSADYLINTKNFRDVSFILIGSGDEYQNCKNLIDKLNLCESIEMPGRIDDEQVKEILSTSDVCLAPDPINGLNEYHTMNKIMDYMRFEKPIVSFDLIETRKTAEKAAYYVEGNDIHKFADAIQILLSDKDKAELMGKYGRERVEKNLRWEIYENIFVEKYKAFFL